MSSYLKLEAEKRLMPAVISYSKKLFIGHWMPSHDLEHHQRVWRNSCELTKIYSSDSLEFYEQLLLACFFHDLGLIFDKSEQHGKKSRELCEQFLAKQDDLLEVGTKELFEAIELHDDKRYLQVQSGNKLYRLLTLADDLDAFGAFGAYRYIEIYLLRGIPENQIPQGILQNAESRYLHLQKHIPEDFLVNKGHTEAYHLLQKIFMDESFSESAVSLVGWIKTKIVDSMKNPRLIFKQTLKNEAIRNSRLLFFLKSVHS